MTVGFVEGKCRLCGKDGALNEGICGAHDAAVAQAYLFGVDDGRKEIQKSLDAARIYLAAMTAERDALKHERNALKIWLETADRERDTLRQQLKAMTAERDAATKQLGECNKVAFDLLTVRDTLPPVGGEKPTEYATPTVQHAEKCPKLWGQTCDCGGDKHDPKHKCNGHRYPKSKRALLDLGKGLHFEPDGECQECKPSSTMLDTMDKVFNGECKCDGCGLGLNRHKDSPNPLDWYGDCMVILGDGRCYHPECKPKGE